MECQALFWKLERLIELQTFVPTQWHVGPQPALILAAFTFPTLPLILLLYLVGSILLYLLCNLVWLFLVSTDGRIKKKKKMECQASIWHIYILIENSKVTTTFRPVPLDLNGTPLSWPIWHDLNWMLNFNIYIFSSIIFFSFYFSMNMITLYSYTFEICVYPDIRIHSIPSFLFIYLFIWSMFNHICSCYDVAGNVLYMALVCFQFHLIPVIIYC